MEYRQLFILVEGDDDVRFVEKIVKPFFEKKYNAVFVRPYAQMKKKSVNNIIKSIKDLRNEYLFLADMDQKNCISEKKSFYQKSI